MKISQAVACSIAFLLGVSNSGSAADGTLGRLAKSQPEATAPAAMRDSLFNDKPSFLVAVRVNRPSLDYREGDTFSIQVASEEDAYLYVIYQQADGRAYQVFPNKFQTDNRVKARQAVQVPAATDLFRWVVGPPFGEETVKVIATKEPVDVLAHPNFTKGRFNPVGKDVLKGIEVELGDTTPVLWAETDVTVHTYPNSHPTATDTARRWGVFFGVSRHLLTPYVVSAFGEDASSDLFACHRDAQQLAEVMRDVGRLDGLKLFTNETATKANFQAAVTEWLPSVSRPGDTVIIFYSGHTGQLPDQNGDEPDGQDEFLVPHDFLGGQELEALKKLYDEDKLTSGDRKFFEQLVANYKDKSLLELVENTGITDDAMARWIQRLEGRQLLFISDSCHSGGFANQETNFKSLKPNFPFDLMKGEVARLKDLGQSNHALLCAAYANEAASERVTHDLGVMTFSLIRFLKESRGSQRLEDGHKFCEVEMEKYFAAWNQALADEGYEERVTPSHPFLINHSSQPVLLKP
ncbi:MAG: DUF4384 domain-containing protein [Planctomycetales bacterium]|nr:DUF4384 domain-containing protein [Planctomycetales bacterium]